MTSFESRKKELSRRERSLAKLAERRRRKIERRLEAAEQALPCNVTKHRIEELAAVTEDPRP